ncbi:transcriptional repressor [Mobilitalea sibirica]|uniref:Transcriptional repressor n=1 Tax=Mobilitalea sibirica TaxID=1462919 RepID=A0A8J7HAN2_9FIRM|nr:transcriptional repressor [Mobilitalea sibirica]MBH1940121.1 transcriptional repressor [Mobilitalea sibirica]
MKIQRNTKQRQLILSILMEADRPISINEIYNKVIEKLPSIAKSTIYRNIDILLKQDLIDKYHFHDNEIFYRIKADQNEHKHYVMCDQCNKMFDLPSCPIHDIETAMEEEGFIIQKHQIQISGICKNCAGRKQINTKRHK